MLDKKNRLSDKTAVGEVLKRGRTTFNEFCRIRSLKNKVTENRFVIIVSNKFSKKATERNRIKRQVRSVIRRLNPYLAKPYDYLIIIRTGAFNKDITAIELALKNALDKQGLI